MIVHMIPGIKADDDRVSSVCGKAERYGLKAEVVVAQGTHYQPIEMYLKDDAEHCSSTPEYPFESMDGVDRVVRVSPSLVSIARNGTREPHQIQIGSAKIGFGLSCLPVLGPCTIDKHIGQVVAELRRLGVKHMRGGFIKPRSQAESFRGLGPEGLRRFLEAARDHGVESAWCEVIDTSNLDDVRTARDRTGFEGDIVVWVGARTRNQVLLQRLGEQREFAVMIKNPIDGTMEDLFTAAEFVLHGPMWWDEEGRLDRARSKVSGNNRIVLCVRGLKKTDQYSPLRFYPNYDWIRALRERAWAPVCFDPSHIAGDLKYLTEVLEQGLRRSPDALLIESHSNPSEALCDKDQALPTERVPEVLAMIEAHNQKLLETAAA